MHWANSLKEQAKQISDWMVNLHKYSEYESKTMKDYIK